MVLPIQTPKNLVEKSQNQDFFSDNEPPTKKEKNKSKNRNAKPYNTTRIKARNLLTNISHSGLKTEDFHIRNFTFDVFVLLTKNLSLYSGERKFEERNSQEMMYMLWEDYISARFYKLFICWLENLIHPSSSNIFYPKTAEMALRHVTKE